MRSGICTLEERTFVGNWKLLNSLIGGINWGKLVDYISIGNRVIYIALPKYFTGKCKINSEGIVKKVLYLYK